MKKLLALLLALVLVLALAACGEKPASDDAASGGSGGSVPAGYTGSADFDWSAYKGVDFQIMWQESDSTQIEIVKDYAMPAIQEIADEYGINFEWVGNVDSSYTTLAATGELADVWFGNVTLEMIQADIMLDLTPYLTVDSYMEDTFTTPSFYYFNGVIWSLSTGVDSFYNGVLYYNKAMFEDAGITADDINTYEGLVEACATLAAKGYGGITLEGGDNTAYSRFLWQNTVIGEDPDAYKAILDGAKDAFQNDAIVASFQQFRTLHDAGYCGQAVNARSTEDAIAQFAAGDYAMLYVDSWQNGAVWDQTQAAGLDVGVAWWPSNNADYETGAFIAGWGSPLSGWCAKADTEHPELAVEVIKVINRAEAARHLAAGLGTNHVQDGAPTPANDLEAQRFELRANVGEFLKGWTQNTVDNATLTEFHIVMDSVCSDDNVDLEALVADMDAAWQDNTFFG